MIASFRSEKPEAFSPFLRLLCTLRFNYISQSRFPTYRELETHRLLSVYFPKKRAGSPHRTSLHPPYSGNLSPCNTSVQVPRYISARVHIRYSRYPSLSSGEDGRRSYDTCSCNLINAVDDLRGRISTAEAYRTLTSLLYGLIIHHVGFIACRMPYPSGVTSVCSQGSRANVFSTLEKKLYLPYRRCFKKRQIQWETLFYQALRASTFYMRKLRAFCTPSFRAHASVFSWASQKDTTFGDQRN